MGAPIFSRSNQHASETQPQSQPTQDMTDSPDLLLEELDHEDNVEVLLESLEGASGGIGKNLEALRSTLGKADITGGDIDDDWYQAEVVGEEAVGGQTPTPDQNITEALQKAVGISAADGDSVRTSARLEWRDRHPWQLNPESAEDYQERL